MVADLAPLKAICLFSFIKLKVVENCALLGYYAASNSKFLQMFQENLAAPPSGFKNP